MPSSMRPKGSSGSNRSTPVTPMSERQQMALLMQMTSGGEAGSRSPSSTSSRSKERNERGETPLHVAAIKGDVDQVVKLLAHRADPNAVDFAGWTPLHEACNRGRQDVAIRLLNAGANVNARGLDDDTPLHDAAANGHVALTRTLLEYGADVNACNSKGQTPRDVAAPNVKPFLGDMTLVMPESVSGNRITARSRDDKKSASADAVATNKQKEETMDVKNALAEDVYEFKSDAASGETSPADHKQSSSATPTEAETCGSDSSVGAAAAQCDEEHANQTSSAKRTFSEVGGEGNEEANSATSQGATGSNATGNDEESRRKKRKDDASKEGKSGTQRSSGQGKGQNAKQSSAVQNKLGSSKVGGDKKSPCGSPKSTVSDAETEDGKSDLKVPPLKIVIPQTSSTEQEGASGRASKNSSQRAHHHHHTALPYVVASSAGGSSGSGGGNSDTNEKDQSASQTVPDGTSSTSGGAASAKGDEKRESGSGENDEAQSCSETDGQPAATSAGNSSGAPSSSTAASTATTSTSSTASSSTTSTSTTSTTTVTVSATSSTSTSTTSTPAAAPVELHPRKRKMKQNKEQANASAQSSGTGSSSGSSSTNTGVVSSGSGTSSQTASEHNQPEQPTEVQVHPHEQPITNCYQLYLNIRKQIGKRRRGLFPVQPKPPQGFKDYLMNRCTYVLAGTAPTTPNINYPQNLQPQMKDLFTDQEKERYRLRTQHVIEKEKLVLSVEQEILRVHGRAARALANQSLPFSVCTILRDEEVYNLITPEQEEKDRNARSRYNGRLFLSWLQDVDDKWEKIKEHMLLRHHNEAESLHAVQKMDWEWKMKELNLCDRKTTPKIEDTHVPMVHVSDDFDLLPA